MKSPIVWDCPEISKRALKCYINRDKLWRAPDADFTLLTSVDSCVMMNAFVARKGNPAMFWYKQLHLTFHPCQIFFGPNLVSSCKRKAKRFIHSLLGHFLIECRKPKTKLITPANHKGLRQSSEPVNTQTRENLRERLMIGSGFTFDWLRKWQECFKPVITRSNGKRD